MQDSRTIPAKSPPQIGLREFVFIIAAIQSLQALAVDMMLPALKIMANELGETNANRRQLVLGAFLVGAAFGSLLPGALADRFGRRPILLLCTGSYAVINVASALVQDFTILLVLRLLLGLLTAGLWVVPMAMVRDRLEGDAMARLQSTITMIFMIVPMLAPSLGQAVLDYVGWRWIFGCMAILASLMWFWVWARLGETLNPAHRQTVKPKVVLKNLSASLTTRSAVGYIFGTAFILGGNFGWLNSSQQLIAEHFEAGRLYPVIFSAIAIGLILTSFTNSQIVERFGARRVSHAALLFYICVSVMQLVLAQDPNETLLQFAILMSLNQCLMGFIGSNFGSIALQPFAQMAGAAASAQTFIRMIISSGIGILIGLSFDGSTRPLAFSLLVLGIVSLIFVLYSENGKLFRRLNPPKRKDAA